MCTASAQELEIEEIVSENPHELTRIFSIKFPSKQALIFTINLEDRQPTVEFLETLSEVHETQQLSQLIKYLRSQGFKATEEGNG